MAAGVTHVIDGVMGAADVELPPPPPPHPRIEMDAKRDKTRTNRMVEILIDVDFPSVECRRSALDASFLLWTPEVYQITAHGATCQSARDSSLADTLRARIACYQSYESEPQ